VGYEAEANERGERLIWLEDAMPDRLGAMRGPGESYSDLILRIAGAGRGGRGTQVAKAHGLSVSGQVAL
jgi:hypothetical protein